MKLEDQFHPDVKSIGFSWYKGVGFIFDLWHKRITWSPRVMVRRQESKLDDMMSECWDDWNK